MPVGVLPKQMLRKLCTTRFITGIDERYLNPASIDLPLSGEAYRLESIFLPLRGEKIRDLLSLVGATPHDLENPLEVGVPYLIRIAGTWRLPSIVYGYANPKSSTGRLGLFCRIVADGVDMYEALIGPGWTGEIWMLVRSDYFSVRLASGLALSQIRFFDGKSFLDDLHIELSIEKHGLLFDQKKRKLPFADVRRHADSLLLSLKVGSNMGYECRWTRRILDLRIGGKLKDFFKPIHASNSAFMPRRNCFYILTTRERIMVPPDLSAELRAIDPRLGEFRSHAAGYIDPGWGYGKSGEARGRPITLEMIPHEDMFVRDGQIIARIRFENMKEAPETAYDAAESHYTDQYAARPSKYLHE